MRIRQTHELKEFYMASFPNRKSQPALLALLLTVLNVVACGGAHTVSNPNDGKKYPFLVDVTLQPATAPSIAVARTLAVRADGGYQVSPNEIDYKTVTSSATWNTSNTAVATVDKGQVTGTGIGSATISATLDGKTGRTLVVVGQTPTVDITPTGPFSLSANPDQHFKASGSYSDGSVLDLTCYATWNSSAPEVLKFYDDYAHDCAEAALLVTGTTTITATVDTGDQKRSYMKTIAAKLFASVLFGLLLSSALFATDYRYTKIDVPNASLTIARGINARGDIIGSYTDADGAGHDFLFHNGVYTNIDYPGGAGSAIAINARGDIAGVLDDAEGAHGFVFSDGKLTKIDYPGAIATRAFGINNSGDITGQYTTKFGVVFGFILSGGAFHKIHVPATDLTSLRGAEDNGRVMTGDVVVSADSSIRAFVRHKSADIQLLEPPG